MGQQTADTRSRWSVVHEAGCAVVSNQEVAIRAERMIITVEAISRRWAQD